MSNTVQSIAAGSPAAGQLQAGDELASAAFPATTAEEKARNKKLGLPAKPLEFGPDHHSWPLLDRSLQDLPIGQKIELTWRRGGVKHQATLATVAAQDRFDPQRGLNLKPLLEMRQVDSWGEAFALGLRETKESVWQVIVTLRKLVKGELSVSGFGGPITIAHAAGNAASEGITSLLMFLTFLSANLAVLNFLPIPILDGGHMMFLLYEGIRGKPASERTMMILTYAGLIIILTLMVFVLGLDITRLF